jgi:cytochrome P450 family 103
MAIMDKTFDQESPEREAGLKTAVPGVTVAELEAAPHEVLKRYRAQTPLALRDNGVYIVFRSKDVERLILDSRLRAVETDSARWLGITEGALLDIFEYSMLTANGAVHRRRRAPFTRTFASRMIADLRPHIRKTAEDLIDSWPEGGEVDFVEQFAALLPARLISEILGLPKQDIPRFTALVYSVTRAFSMNFTRDDLPGMEADARELQAFVEVLIDSRRKTPLDDLLSSFLADADQRGELSPIEIVMQIVILIIGGTDTTRVAMAVQLALLLEHPAQWEAVCADAALVPAAVTEAMRYEPSVASAPRVTLEDIALDEYVLPAGKVVTLSTMSAMRDDAAYQDPDRFDIHRTDHPRLHPIFGGGAHRCIGEALAKAELEEGLSVLATRLPQLRLADGMPKLRGHSGIRRIGTMRVQWSD